jgi:hypothetical protein
MLLCLVDTPRPSVSTTLGICLKGVSSGALKTPMRVRLWTVHESPALANQSACGLEA